MRSGDAPLLSPGRIAPAYLAFGSFALVFENLLHNAVEHNDSTVPGVTVDADAGLEDVGGGVVDNGPGLPEDASDAGVHPRQ